MLVAATSGVSAMIDPDGTVHGPTRTRSRADVLVRAVSGCERRLPSLDAWRAGPEWALVAIGLAGLVLAAVVRRRRERDRTAAE